MTMTPDWGLLPEGSSVLCAVSGGADSMCLLHLLWKQRQERGLRIVAAHFEHGLRGEESLRDAAFVEDWCREQGIPCVMEHGDVKAFAAARGLGIEEAARELRYAFLLRQAEALACTRIATAHNADDNAETLLLHLCRGSGSAGLGGIPPQRGQIVRPLLGCTRGEIEDYLRENAVPHVEDGSNQRDDCARNLLRHRVTPELRRLNPAFAAAAGRTAALLRRDEDCLSQQAAAFLQTHYDGESLPLAELAALHPAIASRALRRLCPGLELGHVETALALCRGNELAYLDLPGLRLRRDRGRLWFSDDDAEPIPERVLLPGVPLPVPEAGLCLLATPGEYGQEIHDLFKTYNFKNANICGKISCTGRRPGDRLRVAGRGCTKSLKALFNEADMTQAQRDRTLVLRDEEGILAVHGLAVAERTLPQPGDPVLRVRIETID